MLSFKEYLGEKNSLYQYWYRLSLNLPHNKESKMSGNQTKYQQSRTHMEGLKANTPQFVCWNVICYCSLWTTELKCSMKLRLTMPKKHWEWEAMCLMEMSSKVVHTHKEGINLGVYKFCASIYFLLGKGSDMNELCHVGLRNLKFEESGFRVYTW